MNFTRDDMEGLYSELANCGVRLIDEHSTAGIPPGPPSASTGEAVDNYCDDFHKHLRDNVRIAMKAVQSNLRAAATPPEGIDEVWNHAIWKYVSTMEEASGTDNEKIIQVTTTIWANVDLDPPPSDGTPDRVETYTYVMQYKPDGKIDGEYTGQNWISATYYAPQNVWRLNYSFWDAENPQVSKSNVDGLYP
ncbi:MAG: hypothetical protein WBE26_12940 [Phycisphaerae bacterium]